MSAPAITVRQLQTSAEIDTFMRLATETFIPGADVEREAARWRRFLEEAPIFEPSQLRGAFRGDVFVGGYLIHERRLRLGSARLCTGCIAAVVTHPDHRCQGVATALMEEAIAFSLVRRRALLLLDGISGFYQRFGYADVLDITEHTVDREAVLALPPSPYSVRPSALEDAPAFLALHERHYGCYSGSFERTLAQQQHCLRHRLPANPPLLALDPEGAPRGYLLHPWSLEDTEVAADNWPALLALLQREARQPPPLLDPPDTLTWPLPPDSPTFYRLADHLPVRSETRSCPREGWMARPAHLGELFAALLPRWQVQWQRYTPPWTGLLSLMVDEEIRVLELGADGLRFSELPPDGLPRVRMSPQVFVQLLFGFRPVCWTADQPGQEVPEPLIPVLEVLFPQEPAWIAGSDAF
jgi:GNAT superfamily N-acetyltransferase